MFEKQPVHFSAQAQSDDDKNVDDNDEDDKYFAPVLLSGETVGLAEYQRAKWRLQIWKALSRETPASCAYNPDIEKWTSWAIHRNTKIVITIVYLAIILRHKVGRL